jgi:hypothetical protein
MSAGPNSGTRLCVRRSESAEYEIFRGSDTTLAAVAYDPYIDATTNVIADALAEYVDLFDQNGTLLWFANGAPAPVRVTPPVLAEIVPKHLAIKKLVNRGTEADPNWAVEYVPLVLSPQNLRAFFTAEKRMGSLITRVPKA